MKWRYYAKLDAIFSISPAEVADHNQTIVMSKRRRDSKCCFGTNRFVDSCLMMYSKCVLLYILLK